MARDVGEGFVAHDAPARDVLCLCLGFAPGRERLEPSQHGRVPARRADAVPGRIEVVGVVAGVRELVHLGVEPHAAPGLDQAFEYLREDLRQVGHVSDRILYLPFGQRAPAPVGEAGALIDRLAEPGFDEVCIADLLGLADRHHRHLGVEDGVRGLSGEVVNDLDVLAAGVKNLQYLVVFGQQFEQRREIYSLRQRVDRCGLLLVANLHQAQQRIVGVLAHEFGIDRDELRFGQPLAEFGEVLGCRDQRVYFHWHFSIGRIGRQMRPA